MPAWRRIVSAVVLLSAIVMPSAASAALGGTDINLITGAEASPRVSQAGSAIWGHWNTVVAAYNDSSGDTLAMLSYCGVSVSTDGGNTFTRLPYKFNTAADCYGQPVVVYSVHAQKWIVGFVTPSCGAGGIGLWTSADAIDWIKGSCASVASADTPSLWVDNNPVSPFFGRLYAAFNDFDVGGAPRVAVSMDDGVTWGAPSTLIAGLRRVQNITGSLGSDGTLFVQTVDEGGGGLGTVRQNFIFRSTDGGATWSLPIAQGPAFPPPGRSMSNGYLVGMYDTPLAGYWTEMGWGEAAVGPDGVVHYAYATGFGPDAGNISYVRSTDNGLTWSPAVRLNTDFTARAQWGVSLSVNTQGTVFVSWYDQRNTSDDALERFGRASLDNGDTWEQDQPISDVIFPKPLQPDENVSSFLVDLHNRSGFSNGGTGSFAYGTWTDGRVSIDGSPQQDVFFDKIAPAPALVVTTLDDHDDGTCNESDCTLREAIIVANARAGEDRIVFAAGLAGTVQVTSALPSIASNIDLAGPGANLLTVQRDPGTSNIRIFTVTAASTFSTISGLTIANGSSPGGGGGVSNAGVLALAKVTIADNHAQNGGGLYNTGVMTISASTVSGNSVSGPNPGSGGGIYNFGGALSIFNSTISGNTASGPGGNSDSGGGIITNVGTVFLANDTITANSGDIGGGIRNVGGGVVRSRNTIVALNTSASGPDVNGQFLSEGYNLIGDGSAASIASSTGDQIGTAQSPVDPLLDVLRDNGGPTFTHALLSGSPAIDQGKSSALSVDQRGLGRPADLPYTGNALNGDGSDIGSFELQSDVVFQDGFGG